MYIKRTSEDVIKRLSKQFKVVLVTGARQVGKSTLLKHCDETSNYVSLDDLSEREMAINEPKLFLENHKSPLSLTSPILWLYAIGLALFPTIISIETINIAIKLIGSTTTAILGSLEPLTALFFGVVFFHEQLTPRIILGIITVISGVILIIKRKQKCNSNS